MSHFFGMRFAANACSVLAGELGPYVDETRQRGINEVHCDWLLFLAWMSAIDKDRRHSAIKHACFDNV